MMSKAKMKEIANQQFGIELKDYIFSRFTKLYYVLAVICLLIFSLALTSYIMNELGRWKNDTMNIWVLLIFSTFLLMAVYVPIAIHNNYLLIMPEGFINHTIFKTKYIKYSDITAIKTKKNNVHFIMTTKTRCRVGFSEFDESIKELGKVILLLRELNFSGIENYIITIENHKLRIKEPNGESRFSYFNEL